MYDSRLETHKHINRVQYFLTLMINELLFKINNHDSSKLESPEKEIFDEMTPKLAGCTYGSDEYKGY